MREKIIPITPLQGRIFSFFWGVLKQVVAEEAPVAGIHVGRPIQERLALCRGGGGGGWGATLGFKAFRGLGFRV